MLTTDFSSFRQASGPLVDVRSPGEFRQGHWPGAINLPLFSDEQRAEVGTTYKKNGRAQAIDLGLELVGPALATMSRQLKEIAGGAEHLRIYCWRGGMRPTVWRGLRDLWISSRSSWKGGIKVIAVGLSSNSGSHGR